MTKLRNMNSAPKDGKPIVYQYDGHIAGECYYVEGRWYDEQKDQYCYPDFWMPIPLYDLNPTPKEP